METTPRIQRKLAKKRTEEKLPCDCVAADGGVSWGQEGEWRWR